MKTLLSVVCILCVSGSAVAAPPKAPPVKPPKAPAVSVNDRSATGDPYGYANYADFYRAVASGIKGVLVVGTEDRYVQSYTAHCRVPSGSYGLADGEYDCFLKDGVQQIQPRKGVSQKASGKADGLPTIGAHRVDTSRRPEVGISQSLVTPQRVISIGVPSAAKSANIDCASPYG